MEILEEEIDDEKSVNSLLSGNDSELKNKTVEGPLIPTRKESDENLNLIQNKSLYKYKEILRKFFVGGMKKRIFLK